jgi:hypothetical protein
MDGKKMKNLKNLWKINLLRQVKSIDQASVERKGDIIRVTITRGATIKVSISGTDRCTQRMNKTGGSPVRRT